jgi:hypothetical protein
VRLACLGHRAQHGHVQVEHEPCACASALHLASPGQRVLQRLDLPVGVVELQLQLALDESAQIIGGSHDATTLRLHRLDHQEPDKPVRLLLELDKVSDADAPASLKVDELARLDEDRVARGAGGFAAWDLPHDAAGVLVG